MSFEEKCVHCEHYHASGTCCYCKKEYSELKKTREEHLEELGEDEIDI